MFLEKLAPQKQRVAGTKPNGAPLVLNVFVLWHGYKHAAPLGQIHYFSEH